MMSDSTYKFHSFCHTKPKHSIKFHSAASSGKFKPQKIRRKPKFLLTGQTRWSSFDFRRRFHPLTVDKSRRGVAADRQINEKFHSAIIRILHPHRISARCRNLHCTPAPLDTSRMNPRCGNSASSTCRGRWQSQTFRAIYFYFQPLYPADTSAVNIGRQSSDRRKIFSFGKRARHFHRSAALIYDHLARLLLDTIDDCFHFSSGHTSPAAKCWPNIVSFSFAPAAGRVFFQEKFLEENASFCSTSRLSFWLDLKIILYHSIALDVLYNSSFGLEKIG